MKNNLFMDILDKGMVIFLDDVLIHSTIEEEHFEILEKVFAYLHKHNFTASCISAAFCKGLLPSQDSTSLQKAYELVMQKCEA